MINSVAVRLASLMLAGFVGVMALNAGVAVLAVEPLHRNEGRARRGSQSRGGAEDADYHHQ